ncbi:polysaccharide biosynthesis protein [Flammeovirgaceae bacterium 311]|nr:polysaccharide biosynthesis protein [Flammeovirgaceae bacterium 311]
MKRLFKKFSQSYWLRSGAFKLFERASIVIFGFIAYYALVRHTSKEEFGTWGVFLMLTGFIEQFRYGFISNGLVRYLNHTDSREDYIRVETGALSLNITVTVLISAFLWTCSDWIGAVTNAPLISPMLQIYAFLNFLMVPVFHLEMMQRANMDFKGSSLGQFANKGLYSLLLIGYIFYYQAVSLTEVVMLQGVGIIAGTFITYYYGSKYMSFTWRFSFSTLKEQLNYGKYTFGTFISAYMMRNIDSWMLTALLGPTAVAPYVLALKISNIFEVPANTVSQVIFPKMVRAIKEEGIKAARPYYEKSVAILFAVMLPFVGFTLLFAPQIVTFIGEIRYAEAIPVLQITVLYGLLLPLDKQVGVMLDATGKQKMNTLFVLRNAVLNIVLNYIYITNMGLIGAALATLTTYIISVILNQIYVGRTFNVSTVNYFKYIGSSYMKAWGMLNKRLKAL